MSSFATFAIGLLIAMFGVGGVENSITNTELAQACAVSIVGLVIMWVGVSLLKEQA